MTKETIIQRHILDGVETAGGWGKKMSNTYVSGIPDLLIVYNASGGVGNVQAPNSTYILEVKKLDALPVRDDDLVKFAHPLTELQHRCLININRAGGCAGWIAIYTKGMVDYIFLGRDKLDIPTKKEFLTKCLTRKRGPAGQSWASIIPLVLTNLSKLPYHD